MTNFKFVYYTRLLSLGLLLQNITVSGIPYSETDLELYEYMNDQSDDVTEVNDNERTKFLQTPIFKSVSQTLIVDSGDTVRLPCIVDRLEGFVMLWKKQGDILTVAHQIQNKRYSLVSEKNGNHLVISQIKEEDAGVYTCWMSVADLTEQHHTVQVRTEPAIRTEPDQLMIVREGSPANLVCAAIAGNPVPKLTWKRRSDADEEIYTRVHVTETQATLALGQVTRASAGEYTCLADNGYNNKTVEKTVQLKVEYPPTVRIMEKTVHTGLGDEEELVCHVTGVPLPKVQWYRDGHPLDSRTNNVLIFQKNGRHSLTLLNIDGSSVGDYQCVANNSEGVDASRVKLTGHAKEAIILSSTESQEKYSYTLFWQVESKSPVSKFIIYLRKVGDSLWKNYEVDVDVPEFIADDDNNNYQKDTVNGRFKITGLEEASVYQVKIAAENVFGLSSPLNIFTFATKGADPVQQPMIVPSAAARKFSSSVPFFVCSFFLLIFFI